ncbi:MAG: replicative DNA helicase [Pseudomonadota bacterium]
MDALRIPPHSLIAEQAILGGLMLDIQAWERITGKVGEQDFYRREHRLIFRAITSLADRNQPFDVVTVGEELEGLGQLDEVGGFPYVGSLAQETPTAANILAYAEIVREHSVLRQLISVGTTIANSAFRPEGRRTNALLDDAERQVFEIADQQTRGGGGLQPIKQVLARVVERIEILWQQDSPITGVATGFKDFDEMTGGLQPSDLIIIAGRPSMGKTTLALNIAENIAIRSHRPVAIFSLEMSAEQLGTRMLSSLGRIDQKRLRSAKLKDEEWPKVVSAMALIKDVKLFIDDSGGLMPTEVRARSRRVMREQGDLALIVIDYLQLMEAPGEHDNEVSKLTIISRSLKALAKELHVPVIALSQLSRKPDDRANRRPVMSDLRGSGSIEQDADVVVFIYRDEVYNEKSPDKGIAEIIIGKQRNGPIGTTKLTFLGQFTKFENFVSDIYLK